MALISSLALLAWRLPQREGMQFWIFADVHTDTYMPTVNQWNSEQTRAEDRLTMFTLSMQALNRRTLAGFWANLPTADVMEVEIGSIGTFLSGPLEDVGFVDITDKLHEEGIYEAINKPSFSPWTSRGRIFGIPHDVHPVVLVYRSDFVAEAGIDVNEVETWDDFARVFRPLISDLDGDGIIDRYLINMWYTGTADIEALLLQAGGGTFDADDNMIVDSEANARVAATVVSWCLGPDRIAIDAPEFSASGNRLKIEGRVVAAIMPDWLAGVWMKDLPQLAGKLRIMPLPAWEPGGRRTSVRGGTMMAMTKTGSNPEKAWEFAKRLYLDEKLSQHLFEQNHIISPVMTHWDKDFYKQPSPYFGGQITGELFIRLAPHVPLRTSSPFNQLALGEIGEAINATYRHAVRTKTYDAEALIPFARERLRESAERVTREMKRNVFLREQMAEQTP
ncbi:ABC transporter substrate-binding protein [Mucisphaera calidilacus]|uniref:ABC transporter substrate-binding protein n=1 Tax=Mucisphaera calidilacus TaxID=2527982 RepID=UPI0011A13324|nr:extracellular solute-binding protein [Mucisphaera calidilacus]